MPYLGLADIDDFLEAVQPKLVKQTWQDISMPLQKYYFASRIFDKAGPEEEEGDHLEFRLQVDNNDNFRFTGLYSPDVTSRKNLLTHGQIGWGFSTTNYNFDIKENIFSKGEVAIVRYLSVLEHSLYTDYVKGMEVAMLSDGPTSPTQTEPPPCSLTWWIQKYNTASGYGNNDSTYQLATGQKSGFLGMNPYGFDSVGTATIDRKAYPGWRNRNGQYTLVTDTDFVETVIECLDKCAFENADSYPETSAAGRPRHEGLTTYSRVKLINRLLAAGNDNIKIDLGTWRPGIPTIRGVPIRWIPAWSNPSFETVRTDGLFLGVDWSSFKFTHRTGYRMKKSKLMVDKDSHDVRVKHMDDSGQLYCLDCRRNFNLTCTETVTETG